MDSIDREVVFVCGTLLLCVCILVGALMLVGGLSTLLPLLVSGCK